MSIAWNPWHGCHRVSEGCRHCYVYRQDAFRGRDGSQVRRTAAFDLPVRRSRDGRFKIPGGTTVYVCLTSDFLLEEADSWRDAAWQMIRLRHDLRFVFFTKRIERLRAVLPADWGDGYENVAVGCTVELQQTADSRLPLFGELPACHKLIICAPLLGPLDLTPWLSPAIEEVSVGGESGPEARVLDAAARRGVSGCRQGAWIVPADGSDAGGQRAQMRNRRSPLRKNGGRFDCGFPDAMLSLPGATPAYRRGPPAPCRACRGRTCCPRRPRRPRSFRGHSPPPRPARR